MIEAIWAELWRFMLYGSIGFVLGAAWCGLGIKNREVDKKIEDKYARS